MSEPGLSRADLVWGLWAVVGGVGSVAVADTRIAALGAFSGWLWCLGQCMQLPGLPPLTSSVRKVLPSVVLGAIGAVVAWRLAGAAAWSQATLAQLPEGGQLGLQWWFADPSHPGLVYRGLAMTLGQVAPPEVTMAAHALSVIPLCAATWFLASAITTDAGRLAIVSLTALSAPVVLHMGTPLTPYATESTTLVAGLGALCRARSDPRWLTVAFGAAGLAVLDNPLWITAIVVPAFTAVGPVGESMRRYGRHLAFATFPLLLTVVTHPLEPVVATVHIGDLGAAVAAVAIARGWRVSESSAVLGCWAVIRIAVAVGVQDPAALTPMIPVTIAWAMVGIGWGMPRKLRQFVFIAMGCAALITGAFRANQRLDTVHVRGRAIAEAWGAFHRGAGPHQVETRALDIVIGVAFPDAVPRRWPRFTRLPEDRWPAHRSMACSDSTQGSHLMPAQRARSDVWCDRCAVDRVWPSANLAIWWCGDRE